jgi:hypothetical protein
MSSIHTLNCEYHWFGCDDCDDDDTFNSCTTSVVDDADDDAGGLENVAVSSLLKSELA